MEKDGVLKGTTNMDDYALVASRWEGIERQWVAALVNFYNPSHVFIGGGVSAIGPLFLAAIRQSVNQRSLALSTRHPEITSAPLGPETAE